MIWNDLAITKWAEAGGVTPFDPKLVNPASLDLRLGNMIRQPHPLWLQLTFEGIVALIENGDIENRPQWAEPEEFDETWLLPGSFVLCHSLEHVQIPTTAASVLFLKSSQGRRGVNHAHSGWGDPGFGLGKGAQWTFEIENIAPWPIKLTAGQPLIQMVLMDMVAAPLLDYRKTGHYVYQRGPTVAVEDVPKESAEAPIHPVAKAAGGLAMAIMQQQLDKGNPFSIPSLGIVIEPTARLQQDEENGL